MCFRVKWVHQEMQDRREWVVYQENQGLGGHLDSPVRWDLLDQLDPRDKEDLQYVQNVVKLLSVPHSSCAYTVVVSQVYLIIADCRGQKESLV